jgi:hypothetical protein
MTNLEIPIAQSIQQAIAIIHQGRALERLFIDAGFTLPGSDTQPELATSPEPSAEPIKPAESNWPKRDPDTDALIDVRGMPWIEAAHSANQTCNTDGTWRRKRGVDIEEIERLETAERARQQPEPAPEITPADESADSIPAEPAPEPDPEPDSDAPAVSEFDKIRAGLEASRDQSEIDEWFTYSREVVISQSQRYALEAIAAERARKWAAENR